MRNRSKIYALPLLALAGMLALSGCSTYLRPVTTVGVEPTPVVAYEGGGVDNPDVYVDIAKFQDALLGAIARRDTAKLEQWMTEPFLTGSWRADLAESGPEDALAALYAGQLREGARPAPVKGANLPALLGDRDPLSIPRSAAGVEFAILVSDWGPAGRDEAILFVARQPDNSLKWHGWLHIPGGFSGARLGGSQSYTFDPYGLRVFLPQGATANQIDETSVTFVYPLAEGGDPAIAWLTVEPAGGRTARQIADEQMAKTQAEMGEGYLPPTPTALAMEDGEAIVVGGQPGQDTTRHFILVRGDRLYRIVFTPEERELTARSMQMEDLYAMMVNTLHFTR